MENYNELERMYTETIIKDSTISMEEMNKTRLESVGFVVLAAVTMKFTSSGT
jgi:hypothetical protein